MRVISTTGVVLVEASAGEEEEAETAAAAAETSEEAEEETAAGGESEEMRVEMVRGAGAAGAAGAEAGMRVVAAADAEAGMRLVAVASAGEISVAKENSGVLAAATLRTRGARGFVAGLAARADVGALLATPCLWDVAGVGVPPEGVASDAPATGWVVAAAEIGFFASGLAGGASVLFSVGLFDLGDFIAVAGGVFVAFGFDGVGQCVFEL